MFVIAWIFTGTLHRILLDFSCCDRYAAKASENWCNMVIVVVCCYISHMNSSKQKKGRKKHTHTVAFHERKFRLLDHSCHLQFFWSSAQRWKIKALDAVVSIGTHAISATVRNLFYVYNPSQQRCTWMNPFLLRILTDERPPLCALKHIHLFGVLLQHSSNSPFTAEADIVIIEHS